MRFKGNNLIKFLIATLFLLALYSFAMFQGDEVSWFLFYSYLPVYIYLFGMLLYSLKRWKITRRLSKSNFFTGDQMKIDLWIKKPDWFPLFTCVVEEVVPKSLNKRNLGEEKYRDFTQKEFVLRRMKRVVFPWFKRNFHFTYEISALPRGKHELTTVRIFVSDLFGFIQKEGDFSLQSEFTVLPKERYIPFKELASKDGQGLGDQIQQVIQSQFVSGSRPYEHGDRLSIIDWKQSAKQQELMTKEFEEESIRKRVFLFNQTIDKKTSHTTFEVAIEISLYLLRNLAQTGYVEFLSAGNEMTSIPLDKMKEFPRVLHHFMQIEPIETTEIKHTLQEVLLNQAGDQSVDLIFITTRLDEELGDLLRHAKRRGEEMTVLFIQAMSLRTNEDERLIHVLRNSDIAVMNVNEKIFTETQAVGVVRA